MFDGIKVLDVSVDVDALLTNDRLTFGGLVDTQTGFVLSPDRRAQDRGLNFRLVPRQTVPGHRVEVKGSLHKFYNNGLHNADQYTVNDLLLTLDQLANEYGLNLFNSKINNIEFGVNVELPFPISQVFDNLICHKNQPFRVDSQSQTPYYACRWQRYTVKIYDKGKQKGLGCNLLRFEIRVSKMEYFSGTSVRLRTLADLLNVSNYELLGALLVNTFNDILFDDPAINQKSLTAKERTFYQQCRNPRYWHTPDQLTPQQTAAHRQQLSRNKDRFRTLLNQHGSNWQGEVSAMIGQTWEYLTAVDDDLLTQIETHKTAWQNGSKPYLLNGVAEPKYSEETVSSLEKTCHKLTGLPIPLSENLAGETCHELTDIPGIDLSQINPLYSEVLCDSGKPDQPLKTGTDGRAPIICPVTGVTIERPRPRQRFISAANLRNNDDLMLTLDSQYSQYAKGSKEDEYSRVAHNVRNQHSNRRNNLQRSINKIHRQPTLFDVTDTLRLTADQRAALDY